MKTFALKSFLACTLAILPSLAQAAAPAPVPPELAAKIAASQSLAKLQEGVIADYGMQTCESFQVVRHSHETAKVSLRSMCTYTDGDGDSSGVLLKVRALTYDDLPLMLEKVEYVFAG